MKNATIALTLLLACAGAAAAELEGVTMPATQQVDGKSLTLNGMGLRSKLMIKVYVAGLYLAAKSSDAQAILQSDEPKRMDLQFLRDVSKDQMVEAYTEAFDLNAPSAKAKLGTEINNRMAAFEPLKKGDKMTFTYAPGKGTTMAVNGQEKVTIPGKEFGQAMFACWIGPKPPSADFKKGVLGT
jgi:hypothetical protein